LQATRIIIISASDGRAQAVDAGADRFLAKPFLPGELFAMVDDVTATPPG
jgi:DNA-binding response OmpR family regulator